MSISKFNLFAACTLISFQVYSFDLGDTYPVFQVGGFIGSQGKQQVIGIEDSLGNEYTVKDKHHGNVLLGLGYYFEGFENKAFELDYGINAFYLFNTKVNGDIIQEQIFTNLDYSYKISQVPVYAAIKGSFKNKADRCAITFDAGLGANFITTSDYVEHSLDAGFTTPNNTFSGKTTGKFSAMMGVGFKINDVIYDSDLELGYRFFYLGKGELNKELATDLDALSTGNIFANALVLSLSI